MSHLVRFARLFVFAAGPGVAALATHQHGITLAAVIAVAGPALETAFRTVFPTVPAKPPLLTRIVTTLGKYSATAPAPTTVTNVATTTPASTTTPAPPASWPSS